MNLTIATAAVAYTIGIPVAYKKMKDWKHPKWQKIIFAVFWPLPAVLYGIHWLHNKV